MGCIQSKGDKYKVEKDGGDTAETLKDAKPAAAAKPPAPATPGGANNKGNAAGGGPQLIPVRTTGEVNNYAGSRPKLDPKDFQFVGLTGEVKVKPPGSINGQAFMIDKCEDCDLYLLDACGQVTVDDCKNCRIFVGPTEGSIFVRDSTGCKCVMVTRQFRVRDCTDCDVALLCRTRPIIESSSNIGFTCYDLNYPGLADHLKAVKLSPLHNAWSSVFDFTPKETANYTLLPKETTAEGLLHPIPQAALDIIRPAQGEPAENPLIVTYGERPALPGHEDSYMFLLFPATKAPAGEAFIREQAAKPHVTILFTNHAQVSADLAGKMAVFAKWSRAAERDIQDGKAVGVELLAAEDYAGIFKKASSQHAYVTDREDAGSLFRLMGIDG